MLNLNLKLDFFLIESLLQLSKIQFFKCHYILYYSNKNKAYLSETKISIYEVFQYIR
jgi:hypothetical protein